MAEPEVYDSLEDIAIIGMSCRFPGAPNIDAFWSNLRAGVESISFFSDEELLAAGVDPGILGDPSYVKAHGMLDDVDLFDAAFFGFTAREAEITDPQHRIFLECAWEALEHAGYDSERYRGLIGVYAGASMSSYMFNIFSNRDLTGLVSNYQITLGNDKDYLSTRVSYKLNLQGPSLSVQSACSTSLVAVCLACQSLVNYQCDIALAGGVAISVPQKVGYTYQEGGILSPDGHCRSFDAQAQGTVGGDGAGIVVLKRLADALADGDSIHAVIKGAALNNDGTAKIGFSAPSVDGQSAVITLAHTIARVDPETITYVESHGTATPMGDPIEVAALTQAFQAEGSDRTGYCALGSVKSNVGHLDAAAGIAGLIKTVLALKHRQIPPSLHFERPNPKIDFENSPFYVNSKLSDWTTPYPRRAGVSSFGIGGTNAHVILEQAPAAASDAPVNSPQLLLLSAKTDSALETATTALASHLKQHPDLNLADVAYTFQVGRRAFSHRRMVVCHSREDAIAALEQCDAQRVLSTMQEHKDRRVAFLFPGQGAQYIQMGRDLYETQATFRAEIDRCAALLESETGIDLQRILYPDSATSETTGALNQTALAQPALFAVEYALAKMWMALGVRLGAMIGHSIGEYVAACLAGVMTLEDALRLVTVRGQLMQSLPHGAMSAVPLPEDKLQPLLEPLSLAAVNGPASCVVAGPIDAIEALEAKLAKRGVDCRRLHTSHAFHSLMVEPIVASFLAEVERIALSVPTIPYISNVTGTWITAAQATDPHYWVQHLRQTVRFADGLNLLLQEPDQILLEVGPGHTLSTLTRLQVGASTRQMCIPSLRRPQDQTSDRAILLNALGRLWLAGVELDWAKWYGDDQRQRLALPTYPFERKRYWIAAAAAISVQTTPAETSHDGQKLSVISVQDKHSIQTPNKETSMTNPHMAIVPASIRTSRIVSLLQDIFGLLFAVDAEDIDPNITFVEMGADSLFLLQASQSIQSKFGIRLPFRLLLEDLSTIHALSLYIDQKMPPEEHVEPMVPSAAVTHVPTPATPPSAPLAPPAASTSVASSAELAVTTPVSSTSGGGAPLTNGVEQLIAQQLQLMDQQSQIMRRQLDILASASVTVPSTPPSIELPTTPPTTPSENGTGKQVAQLAAQATPSSTRRGSPRKAFVPYQPIQARIPGGLNAHQRQHLDALIARINERTPTSKQLTQHYRPVFADNRATAGFRLAWKEIVYPLNVAHAEGARIWDVDGNEYVDIAMGYGALMFGHSAPFVIDALESQIKHGIGIGPHTHLAGQVSEMIRELTGMERVAFCNSGTEAIMAALRVARAVTGRNKIAIFSGSYHGTFDGTLVVAQELPDGSLRAIPMCPGVTPNLVADVIILEFGTEESLDLIRTHAHELAAVLVEPTQSRRPDHQPIEFLKDLRQLTQDNGVALIFDEVVTGFRMHPRGIQGLYGIQADITAYGKAVGGGMPVGIFAGSATYMDAVDGGMWQYGDDSFPETTQTYFTGTYFKHPFVMAVLLGVLTHLKQNGPQLQERLSQRTAYLVATLNAYFEEQRMPMEMVHFGSLFRFTFRAGVEHGDLFFRHMLEHGVYAWEGRTCFLSTAHTDEDIAQIIEAAKISAQQMRDGGFFPDPVPDSGEPLPSPNQTIQQVGAGVAESGVATIRSLPLSEAQKELWALAHMEIDAARAYNESMVLRLRGPLQLAVLRRSLQTVVDRHEALRTSFSPQGEVQYIHPTATLEIPVIDFSGSDDQATRFSDWLIQARQQPFDFVQGPLLRAYLIRLREDEHVLALIYHHIIADGLSVGIVIQELSALYSAACQGLDCALPQPMQYSAYTEDQTRRQHGPEIAATEAYWLDRFADTVPVLELPTDRPRPSTQTYHGAEIQHTLSRALYQELKAFSKQHGSTLFTVLLSAFEILLHRLSHQRDIVIGVPATGRSFTGDEYLVGHCVNLLPIRSKIVGDPTFKEYLTASKKTVLDSYDHQHYPFRRLVNKLRRTHNQHHMPIVSVVFNVDQGSELRFFGLDIVVEKAPVEYTNFDLDCSLTEMNHDLTIDCKYNSDLFDASTVQRMMGYFQVVLEGIIAQPEQRVSRLPILTAEEWTELVVTRNATQAVYPSAASFHQLFVEQAARTPDAIAVVFQERVLTYRQLDARANQIAHQLQQLGVGPNVPVALCLQRSLDLVVALLGVFKAGGAFLPLDPAFPAERMSFMLHDTQSPVLLTQEDLLTQIPPYAGACLCVDRDWPTIARQPTTPPASAVTAEDLAYVIYTSGSTGKPKGVLVPHRGLINYLYWCLEAYGAAHGRGAPVHASIAADAIFPGLFAPLLVGTTTVVLPEEQPLESLATLMQQPEPFSLIKITPSQLSVLNQQLPPSAAAGSVRTLVVGAEEVRGEVLNFWQTHAPDVILLNEYGPTETVVGCSIYQVPPGRYRSGTVPIGLPIANLTFYVLDRHLQPVPIGVPGELYIGGDGVAWGYLNRPDLTAEKFIPDPFSGQAGGRLYKTGDLVRQLVDRAGNIEFLGRQDDQVKIRGYRVELGEVETMLRQHPAVRDVVVLAREDSPGDRRLVAYVVQHTGQTLTVDEMRQYVQTQLPGYMVPAAVVLLNALPLAPHGKIDRKALPAPDHARPMLQHAFVAPLTAMERQLAHIWSDVLGVDRIGAHDNFFDLGGDSILAIRIISRANETGLRLQPKDLFQHPTVAELAAVAEAMLVDTTAQEIVTGPLPLTPIQHWFFEQRWPMPHYFNLATLVETPPDVSLTLLEQAVQQLVVHHDVLRLRVNPTPDGWQAQIAAPDERITLVRVDLSAYPVDQQAAILEQTAAELHASLNITQGPIMRAAYLFRGPATTGRLLLVIHHLVVDLSSWQILLDALRTSYRQLGQAQPVTLPPKTTSFRAWAERLTEYAQSPELERERAYWLAPTRQDVAPLPVDYPYGSNTVASTNTVTVALSVAETQVLVQDVPKAYHTQMSEVVLMALAQAVQAWSGVQKVLIDLEGHGREPIFADVDLARTVGWFTNMHPVLLDLGDAVDPGAALQAIKAQVRSVPEGGIGYGVLRYLKGDTAVTEALRALPQSQILFNYLGRVELGAVRDPLFPPASEASGPGRLPAALRGHLLEINGFLADGQVQLELIYSEQIHQRETIEGLGQHFLSALRDLAAHSQSPDIGGLIPSDFPLANLNEEKFSKLAKLIDLLDLPEVVE